MGVAGKAIRIVMKVKGEQKRLPKELGGTEGVFDERALTELQTGCGKRVWMLLILKGRFWRVPPPPVFWQKRL